MNFAPVKTLEDLDSLDDAEVVPGMVPARNLSLRPKTKVRLLRRGGLQIASSSIEIVPVRIVKRWPWRGRQRIKIRIGYGTKRKGVRVKVRKIIRRSKAA